MCIRDRSIPVDAADKAHGQTAYDSEDIAGGMGLLTPEGPAVDAEEEAFIRDVYKRQTLKCARTEVSP